MTARYIPPVSCEFQYKRKSVKQPLDKAFTIMPRNLITRGGASLAMVGSTSNCIEIHLVFSAFAFYFHPRILKRRQKEMDSHDTEQRESVITPRAELHSLPLISWPAIIYKNTITRSHQPRCRDALRSAQVLCTVKNKARISGAKTAI